MVVRAVIDGFRRVLRQRPQHIHRWKSRFLRRPLEQHRLVKAGRACPAACPPNLRRRGNQSQQHLTACQFGEFFYRRQILLHLRRLRLLHLSDERIAAEIDTVKFSLPQQQLTPGLQSVQSSRRGNWSAKYVSISAVKRH